MKSMIARILTAAALLTAASIAFAQGTPQEPIPFEGGKLTIAENEDLEKVLAFDGKELVRNYVVYFDRIVDLGDVKVALFQVGGGGNQCGTATVVVWKPRDGEIRSQAIGEDCGSPAAAVTNYSIYFVPYLLPGASDTVQVWTPDQGLEVAGTVTFAPQPGTGWKNLDPDKLQNIVDSLKNEAVYAAAQQLLGDRLTEVITGLLTGGGTQLTASGIFYASGCVPHACGSADGFMAVDPRGQRVYFAQEGADPEPVTWPQFENWPAEVKEAMKTSLQE